MSKPIAYQSLSKKTSSIEYKIWIIFFLLCVVGILIYKIGRIEVPSQSLTSESRNTNSHLQYKKLVPGLYEQWELPEQTIQIVPSFTDPTRRSNAEISLSQLEMAKLMFTNLMANNVDQSLFEKEKVEYEKKYQISTSPELPICVVVPTFNNVDGDRFKINIDSILNQEYSNYRVIVIDDLSSDKTGEAINYYLESKSQKTDHITVQINDERRMALPNILDAAHNFCRPYELFMVIDGDDYLLGKQVFKLFSSVFYQSKCWVAYSNFLTVSKKVGYSRPYPQSITINAQFRKVLFVISHLRVFYTKLITLIDEADLKDQQGNWFRAANDVAIYMPVLQMSQRKIKYIRELNYFYNSQTNLNNHSTKRLQQRENEKYIRGKRKYEELAELLTFDEEMYLQQRIKR